MGPSNQPRYRWFISHAVVATCLGGVPIASATTYTFDLPALPSALTLGGDMKHSIGGNLYCEDFTTDDWIDFATATFVNRFKINALPRADFPARLGGNGAKVDVAALDASGTERWSQTLDLSGYATWGASLTVTVQTHDVSRLVFRATGRSAKYPEPGFWPSVDDLVVDELHLPGDADDDGDVDRADLDALLNGYLNQLTGWSNGDFNSDGRISPDDFAIFQLAYAQQTQTPGPAAAPVPLTPTPEPATATLVAGAFLLPLRRHRR